MLARQRSSRSRGVSRPPRTSSPAAWMVGIMWQAPGGWLRFVGGYSKSERTKRQNTSPKRKRGNQLPSLALQACGLFSAPATRSSPANLGERTSPDAGPCWFLGFREPWRPEVPRQCGKLPEACLVLSLALIRKGEARVQPPLGQDGPD